MTTVKKRAIDLLSGMNYEKLIEIISFAENLQNETKVSLRSSNDTSKRREAINRLVGLTASNPVSLKEAKAERLSKL
jgi:hypothetical protein